MMTVTIELPDDQVAALKAKAAAQGLTLEDWIQKLARREASVSLRRARKGQYSLSELLAQCDMNAPLSAEDKAWMDAPIVGREVL